MNHTSSTNSNTNNRQFGIYYPHQHQHQQVPNINSPHVQIQSQQTSQSPGQVHQGQAISTTTPSMLNYNPASYIPGYAQSNYTQNHPLNSHQTPLYNPNPNEITGGTMTTMTMRQQEERPYFTNYYNQSLHKPGAAGQLSARNSDSLIMNFPITGSGLKSKNVERPPESTSTFSIQSVAMNSIQSSPIGQGYYQANQYQQQQQPQNSLTVNQQQFSNYPAPHYQNQPNQLYQEQQQQYGQQYGSIMPNVGPVLSQSGVNSISSRHQVQSQSQVQPQSIPIQSIVNNIPQQIQQTQITNQQKFQQQQQQQNTIKLKQKSPSNLDLLTSLNDADFSTSITEPLSPVSSSAICPNSLSSESADKIENEDIQSSIPSESSETDDDKKDIKPQDSSSKIIDPIKSTTVVSKDIFTWDPVLLEKLTFEVEKLEKTVESFHKKSLSGPTALDLKWRDIQDVQISHVGKKSISVARCYPMKNRFPDILPYDQTRVPLPQTKDDYINASFIKDLSPNSIPFIVTQSPLPSTINDFWSMIFHHNIELIVCLTNDSEVKEHIYWPIEKLKPLEVGNLHIQLHTKNNLNNKNLPPHTESGIIERIFYVTNRESKITRVVVHLQFTNWVSNVFPESPSQFLSFVYEVHSFFEKQRRNNPIVVHCLSGVGKSAAFILLSSCLREINLGNGIPDLIQIAAKANDQRKGVLIDKEYLRFTYQCLLYSCQEILMKHGILSTKTSSMFESDKSKRHHRHPSQDYNFFFEDSVKKLLSTENNKSESKTELESSNSTLLIKDDLEKDLKTIQLNANNEEIKIEQQCLSATPTHHRENQNDSCTKSTSNSNPTLASNSIGDIMSEVSSISISSFNSSTVSLPNTPVKTTSNTNSSAQSKDKEPSSNLISLSSSVIKEPGSGSSSNNPLDMLDMLDPLWNFKK